MLDSTLWDSSVALQRYLDGEKYDFCFIGGIAYQRWGEPRVTEDLDLTLMTEFGREKPVIETILKRFQARIPDPVQFALQSRVLLLRDAMGSSIDLALGGMPFEQRIISRATMWGTPVAGEIRTCTAEDLVVLKSFASRPQDWIDVEKVIIRQGDKLDRELIMEELDPLVKLKEEPEITAQLTTLYEKHSAT